ncbi:MAG TPA: amino acid adenylation domain-containing protein [Pilimelia sp.]|nr:amino acid adenylation domain-containing protein [Pilimelia sp.]
MSVDLGGTAHPQHAWNNTAASYPDSASLVELFAHQVRRRGDAVAVSAAGVELTYADLDRWADRLAGHLLDVGVEPGEPVGLLGERGWCVPAAMLGILRAGGAYVPLDRSDPIARLRMLVDELAVRRIVTMPGCDGLLDRIPGYPVESFRDGPTVTPRPVRVDAGSAAYVMFTSGSTGTPKAVAVPHRAVTRLVIGADYVDLTPDDRVAHTGHLSFDASVFEIWGALLNGARLVVVDSDVLLDPGRLAEFLRRERITVLWLSAGVFHQCAGALPGMFGELRYLISGGDVLIPDAVREVLRAGAPRALLNGYGPTENTTFSATHRVVEVPAGAARIPIGRPIANSTCYVVRDDGTLADVGEEGELVVGGDGVALGYVNSPALTAARFVPDPYARRPGARRYRTGDRARWLPEGVLDFLGRRDRMVKLRDVRIELDEVEAVLHTHPRLRGAAVTTAGAEPASRALVAFYTAGDAGGCPPTGSELRAFLAQQLPAAMVPARYVLLDRIPLTPAGKVDRVALGHRAASVFAAASGVDTRGRARQPVTPVQVGLARLWAELLDATDLTLDASFFELGGNSLLAARVFARLQAMFGIPPEAGRFLTRRLLADPSLEACAEAVVEARDRSLRQDDTGASLDLVREARSDVPLPARPGGGHPGTDVLLTGATGFLGSYLLRELLAAGRRVHCLVRAVDEERARHRLTAAQARYDLGDLPLDRVLPVAGDLAAPLLGLEPATFDRLARDVGQVVHSAAYVNFTYPYHHLAPVTVGGTREVIRLAGRHHGAAVHFVSTMAVLAAFAGTGVRTVTEDTALAYPERLYMGYPETKWVAEEMLRHAAAAGLPVAVYRPYEIAGDLRTGGWNLESATCALFRVIADVGAAPDVDLPLDLVPVDVLARQITHIALGAPPATGTYHLANPRPGVLDDMVRRLRAHGYPVRPMPLDQWVREVVGFVSRSPDHPFAPFIPLWVDRSPLSGLVVKEMYLGRHFPAFTRDRAEAALAGTGIDVPPVDDALLDHYIAFFQRSGFLPAPPGC